MTDLVAGEDEARVEAHGLRVLEDDIQDSICCVGLLAPRVRLCAVQRRMSCRVVSTCQSIGGAVN